MPFYLKKLEVKKVYPNCRTSNYSFKKDSKSLIIVAIKNIENNSLLILDTKVKSNNRKRYKNNISKRNPRKDKEDKKQPAKKNLKRKKNDEE